MPSWSSASLFSGRGRSKRTMSSSPHRSRSNRWTLPWIGSASGLLGLPPTRPKYFMPSTLVSKSRLGRGSLLRRRSAALSSRGHGWLCRKGEGHIRRESELAGLFEACWRHGDGKGSHAASRNGGSYPYLHGRHDAA